MMTEPMPRTVRTLIVAIVYIAIAWVLLEALDVLTLRLDWPQTVYSVVVGVLAVGFLVAVGWTWLRYQPEP